MQALIENEVHRQQAIEFLKHIPLNGKRKYHLVCTVWRKVRTLRQNKLLHMWIRCLAEETGNDHADIHEYLKKRFLPNRHVSIGNYECDIVPSTTTLDTGEMTRYLDLVRQWAMDELGVVLPLPDELGFDSLVARYGEER